MPCVAPKNLSVPSCQGYLITSGDGSLRYAEAQFVCRYCKPLYNKEMERLNRQKSREADRTGKLLALTKQKFLTGTELQKKLTAITEQVLVELFHDTSRSGNPPADFALMVCGSMARREMVSFSDIDAFFVISRNDRKSLGYFKDLALRMDLQLQTAGMRAAHDGGIAGNSGFVFCPGDGGLSPINFCDVPDVLVQRFADQQGGHMRGGLFPRMVLGDPIWAKSYIAACDAVLKRSNAAMRQNALTALRALIPRRTGDLAKPRSGAPNINLKESIYRPVQLIPNEIAIYYGISAQGTRQQILALVEGKHMSLEVAQLFMESLEVYAKVVNALQLKHRGELHGVLMRPLPKGDPLENWFKGWPVLEPWQRSAVESTLPRVEAIWEIATEFLRQKSKTGLFVSKKNPFTSTQPYRDFNIKPA